MGLLEIILIGIVQGVTEFLPVSSSGHLTLLQYFVEKIPESLSLNIAVHLGTLLTIFVFYRKDLKNLIVGFLRREPNDLRSVGFILLATVPTAVLGLTVKTQLPFLLSSPWLVGICLFLTGCVLFSSKWTVSGPNKALNWKVAAFIGVIQGFAVLPGLSRSGLTIVGALWLGLEKEAAARFSFLISVPAILGAALLEVLSGEGPVEWMPMASAALVSFLVGLGAIYLVVWMTKKQRLSLFSYYLWCAGLFVLLQLSLSGAVH